jgi:hypothetical protein
VHSNEILAKTAQLAKELEIAREGKARVIPPKELSIPPTITRAMKDCVRVLEYVLWTPCGQ